MGLALSGAAFDSPGADFGDRVTGTGASSAVGVTLRNTGNTTLDLDGATLSGASAAAFVLVNDGCGGRALPVARQLHGAGRVRPLGRRRGVGDPRRGRCGAGRGRHRHAHRQRRVGRDARARATPRARLGPLLSSGVGAGRGCAPGPGRVGAPAAGRARPRRGDGPGARPRSPHRHGDPAHRARVGRHRRRARRRPSRRDGAAHADPARGGAAGDRPQGTRDGPDQPPPRRRDGRGRAPDRCGSRRRPAAAWRASGSAGASAPGGWRRGSRRASEAGSGSRIAASPGRPSWCADPEGSLRTILSSLSGPIQVSRQRIVPIVTRNSGEFPARGDPRRGS